MGKEFNNRLLKWSSRHNVQTAHRTARIFHVTRTQFFSCARGSSSGAQLWTGSLDCNLKSHSISSMFHRTLLDPQLSPHFSTPFLHLHLVRLPLLRCDIPRCVHPLPLCKEGYALADWLNNPSHTIGHDCDVVPIRMGRCWCGVEKVRARPVKRGRKLLMSCHLL